MIVWKLFLISNLSFSVYNLRPYFLELSVEYMKNNLRPKTKKPQFTLTRLNKFKYFKLSLNLFITYRYAIAFLMYSKSSWKDNTLNSTPQSQYSSSFFTCEDRCFKIILHVLQIKDHSVYLSILFVFFITARYCDLILNH